VSKSQIDRGCFHGLEARQTIVLVTTVLGSPTQLPPTLD